MTPESEARVQIDHLLSQAGWDVQNSNSINLYAARGVAVREFRLKPGHGQADYLLYVDGKAAGVVEAKPVGSTLTGVEIQSGKYSSGLPDNLPSWHTPLPFLFESIGAATRFTNGLDPYPRSRPVFAFHRPETLAEWVGTPGTIAATTLRDERMVDESGTGLPSRGRQWMPVITSTIATGRPGKYAGSNWMMIWPIQPASLTGTWWPTTRSARWSGLSGTSSLPRYFRDVAMSPILLWMSLRWFLLFQ